MKNIVMTIIIVWKCTHLFKVKTNMILGMERIRRGRANIFTKDFTGIV